MKKLLLGSLLILTQAASAKAADFRPYVGLYTGYHMLDTDRPENDKGGVTVGGKLVGSLEMNSWFLDLAGGYEYEKLDGHGGPVSIKQNSPYAELDARLKLSEHLSLGPVASFHFGTDLRHQERVEDDSSMWMAGAKLMYQNSNESRIPLRVELALKKSIQGLDDRDLYAGHIGIQIGFPRAKQEVAQMPREEPMPPAPIIIEKPVYSEDMAPDVTVTLTAAKTKFKTGKYEVDPQARRKIQQIGQYLSAHPEAYEMVQVAGHTDRRGSADFNQRLSFKRAEAVKNILVDAGVPASKINAKGYGPTYPVDDANNEEAWAKNRRTEIKFYGVKDKDMLNKQMQDFVD